MVPKNPGQDRKETQNLCVRTNIPIVSRFFLIYTYIRKPDSH